MCVSLLSVVIDFNLCVFCFFFFFILCISVIVHLFIVLSCLLAFLLCTSCTILIIIILGSARHSPRSKITVAIPNYSKFECLPVGD